MIAKLLGAARITFRQRQCQNEQITLPEAPENSKACNDLKGNIRKSEMRTANVKGACQAQVFQSVQKKC